MAGNKRLAIQLELQAERAKQTLDQLGQQARRSLSPQSGAFQKELETVNQLNARIRQLSLSAITFAKQGQQGAVEYAKITNEIASLTKRLRDVNKDQASRNDLIREEVRLRKEANQAVGGRGVYSPHSERQLQRLNTIAGAGVSGLGQAAGIGISIGAALGYINQLGEAAKKTADTFSDSGGALDKLRQSSERLKQSQDRLATSPAIVGFQTGVNEALIQLAGDVQKTFGEIKTLVNDIRRIFDAEGVRREEKAGGYGSIVDRVNAAARGEQGRIRLTGQASVENERMKADQAAAEKELYLTRLSFERDLANKRRDLILENKEAELQAARERARIILDARRAEEDHARTLAEFNLDFEGRLAEERFRNQREVARREYEFKRADAAQDQANRQADARHDQANRQADRAQDFANSQSDAAQDFGLSNRNRSQDYERDRARGDRDFRNRLFDMSMSNASGLSFLQAARDERLRRADAAADYQTEQARAAEQFGIERSRAGREYGLEAGRDARDFGLEQGRQSRDFGLEQGRAARDFAAQEETAIRERALEIEAHLNERRVQSIELEINYQRTLQNSAIALQQWTENLAISRERRGNRASDLAFEETQGRAGIDLAESERRRGMRQQRLDFAQRLKETNRAAFDQFVRDNPEFAELDAENRRMRNEPAYNPTTGGSAGAGANSGQAKPGGLFSSKIGMDINKWVMENMVRPVGGYFNQPVAGSLNRTPGIIPAGPPAVPAALPAPIQVNMPINIQGGASLSPEMRRAIEEGQAYMLQRIREAQAETDRRAMELFRMYR